MPETDEGGETSFVVRLALLLVAIVIAGFFVFGKLVEVWSVNNNIEQCRRSVELHSIAHISGESIYDDFDCPAYDKIIKSGSEEQIKEQIANEMANCWYKWGRGKKELFSAVSGPERFCAICSFIQFEGPAKDRQLTGFSYYLATHKPRAKFKNESYASYLTPYSPTQIDLSELKNKGDLIDTNINYAVIFVYTKEGHIGKIKGTLIGMGVGGTLATSLVIFPEPVFTKSAVGFLAIGTLLGGIGGSNAADYRTADWEAGTILIPYTEQSISSLNCEKLPARQNNK
ncbi:MAG: hypothetical protein QXK37_02245 [Candidatus Woesearchaeota archaeon]